MIRYEKLFNRLSSEQLSQYVLTRDKNISPSLISRLRHNRGVSTGTLNSFCELLHCSLSDIAEYSENTEDTFVDQRYIRRSNTPHVILGDSESDNAVPEHTVLGDSKDKTIK